MRRAPAKDKWKTGWNCEHSEYVCKDGTVITACSQIHKNQEKTPGNSQCRSLSPQNGIIYTSYSHEKLSQCLPQAVLVSGSELNRDMTEIVRCQDSAKTIVFPRSIRRIRESAFKRVKSLISVVTNDGLEEPRKYRANGVYDHEPADDIYYSYSIFAESPVRRIKLSPGPVHLRHQIFYQLCSLKEITLSEGLQTIGEACFYGCQIASLTVPASVRSLGAYAFAETALAEVVFKQDSCLESIGKKCFYRTALKEFVAPHSLREICLGAFNECKYLRHVTLNEGLETLSGGEERNYGQRPPRVMGLFEDSALESVVLPSTLKKLGMGTFKACGHLKIVELPPNLEEIGDECFSCGIERVLVPASVRRLGKRAFEGNKLLRVIEFAENSKLAEVDEDAFAGCEEVTLRVQLGMELRIEAYAKGATVVRLPTPDARI